MGTRKSKKMEKLKKQKRKIGQEVIEGLREVCIMEQRIGGPSSYEEECVKCKNVHKIFRAGSWDWQPKLCANCEMEALLSDKGFQLLYDNIKSLSKDIKKLNKKFGKNIIKMSKKK